jgi:hypothetical protein
MKKFGWQTFRRVLPLMLWVVLVQGVVPVWGGPTGPSLTALVNRVAPGDQLVISSNKDNAFDALAANNEVVFLGPKGVPKPQKGQAVSPEGRTLTVLVPSQAQSGEVTVKAKGAEIDKVALTISEKPREYQVCLWMALVPVSLFLIFLIWLGVCLHRDPNWKLSGALSEQIEQKLILRDSVGNPVFHATSHDPIYEIRPVIVNSSSRLIAFVGLFVIATEILGVLIPAGYRYACTGEIPDLSNFSTFILAQTPVFAPYVVNKFTKKQEKQEEPPPTKTQ